jgi:anti-anti-sigma factor
MNEPFPEYDDIEIVLLEGRIDSITCRETESVFRDAVMTGKRTIVADMAGVNYVSSAGLRVFLSFQKELKKAGGEVCFLRTAPAVFSIFTTSGFTKIFRFLASVDEMSSLAGQRAGSDTREVIFESGTLKILTYGGPASDLSVIGTEEKLPSADYTEHDVRSIQASRVDFGAGLTALGNDFENFRDYFGESAIIDGNIFVYPAMPRSAVDFIIHSSAERDTIYHFLYGFSFPGKFGHLVSFDPAKDHATLDELVRQITSVAASPMIGITGIFESRGLFGMRLKKVPFKDNQRHGTADIFSPENFPEWIDYSIEAEDMYNLVVFTGIAVRDPESVTGDLKKIFPAAGLFHLHGIVFDRKPFNKVIDNFSNELRRITTGMEPQRVLHLLGKTRVGQGLFGIVELNG